MTWDHFFDLCSERAESLRDQLETKVQQIILQPSHRQGSLFLLGVGLRLGLPLILDEKCLLSAKTPDQLCWNESILPAAWRLNPPILHYSPGHSAARWNIEAQSLTFCTSGSSGSPKLIAKSGRGLLAELNDLQILYQLEPNQEVLSLVSPLHIYGFLHSFLLPMLSGSRVSFAEFDAGLYQLPAEAQSRIDLLIAVPATWSLVKNILQEHPIGTLVMSGAAFGSLRQSELKQLPSRPKRSFEIFGSTETGAIGFRYLNQEIESFTVMPSVRVLELDLGQSIESPYVWPELQVPLADRLLMEGPQQFRSLGRSDRVFKYAGQRFSLAAIEQALQDSLPGMAVVCVFCEDQNIAQGGRLEAYVESPVAVGLEAMRAEFIRAPEIIFPQKFFWIPSFPRDSQGKIQQSPCSLSRLVKEQDQVEP